MNELAKIESFQKELALAETFEEIKLIGDAAQAYAEFLRRQKIGDDGVDKIGRFLIDVESKKGEWLDEHYPHGVNAQYRGGAQEKPPKMPVSKKESVRARAITKLSEDEKKDIFDEIKKEGGHTLPTAVYSKIKKKNKQKQINDTKNERFLHRVEHRPVVYNESCGVFLNRIMDHSVDLLITDPPYSTDVDDLQAFLDTWLYEALSKVKDFGRAFICIGAYPGEIRQYLNMLVGYENWIVDSPLIWTYRNTLGQTPKMKYKLNYQMILHLYKEGSTPLDNRITNEMFSVQDINAPDGRIGDRYYKWQKPDKLAKRLIFHTTKPDDTIIDPFVGIGTFVLQAAQNGRIALGCDIDAEVLKTAENLGCDVRW